MRICPRARTSFKLRRLGHFLTLCLLLAATWLSGGSTSGSAEPSHHSTEMHFAAVHTVVHHVTEFTLHHRDAWLAGGIVLAIYVLLGGPRKHRPPTRRLAPMPHRVVAKTDKLRDPGYYLCGSMLLMGTTLTSLVWYWIRPLTLLQRSLTVGLGLCWSVVFGVYVCEHLLRRNRAPARVFSLEHDPLPAAGRTDNIAAPHTPRCVCACQYPAHQSETGRDCPKPDLPPA